MSKKTRFILVDILLIAMMIIPLLFGMVLKVLTNPPSDGIDISGALVYFKIPLPLGGLPITEAQINSCLVLISIFAL